MKIKSTIVVAAAAGSAFAPNADAQPANTSLRPGATPAPMWSWTGFYVGAHVGYGWQNTHSASGTYNDSGTLRPWNYTTAPKGFLGGGQIGYNWQAGFVVFGAEADISGLTGNRVGGSVITGPTTIDTAQGIKWVGTVRGRLGVTVTPRTLVYATGGLAYGRVENHVTVSEDGPKSFATLDEVKTGYAVGGGIEHAILNNVTVRLEGMHIDLGSTNVTTSLSGSCETACLPVNLVSGNTLTTVRGGVNVRF